MHAATFHRIPRAALLLSVTLLNATLIPAFAEGAVIEIRSLNPLQFYIQPGAESRLVWDVQGASAGEELPYQIEDITGKAVTEGEATVTSSGKATAAVSLPQGFYYLRFPGVTNRVQRHRGGNDEFDVPAAFGIAALPEPEGELDRFFALHSELVKTFYTDPDTTGKERRMLLDSLVAALPRAGIGLVRERLRPGIFHKGPNQWEWQGADNRPNPHFYEDMRQAFKRHGVEVMSFTALAPFWQMRQVDRDRYRPGNQQYSYPTDLLAATRSWLGIHQRWDDVLRDIELYNEPHGAVEDRLSSLIHAMVYAFDAADLEDRPLIGSPGFAGGVKSRLTHAMGRLEVFGVMDFLGFHTYSNPKSIEGIVAGYRDILAEHGHEGLPIRLTESGSKFVGPPIPTPEQRVPRASQVLGNMLESRATGVSHAFSFIYSPRPWNVHGDQHQILNPDGSPMATMAATAHAAVVLAHSEYAGDLKLAGVDRARVFTKGDRAYVVMLARRDRPERLLLPFTADAVLGVDGRMLGSGRTASVPDGLGYVVASKATVMPHVNAGTDTMRLYRLGREGRQTAREPGRPIVLQHLPDYDRMNSSGNGYALTGFDESPLNLKFRVQNLSSRPHTVRLDLDLPPWLVADSDHRYVDVPPRGATVVRWPVKLDRDRPGIFDEVTLRGTSSDAGVAPEGFGVVCPRDLDGMLANFEQVRRIDVSDRGRWSVNKDGRTGIDLAIDDEKVVLKYDFSHTKAWSAIDLSIGHLPLEQASGLIVVVRGTNMPEAGMRFWPKPSFSVVETRGGRYKGGGVPANGEVQFTYLPFDNLSITGFGQTDDNQMLDPDQIENLTFHTWHGTPGKPFTYEIHAVYAVGAPK